MFMSDFNENELKQFTEKVNGMLECKFILSEIRMTALLKTLVSLPTLMQTLEQTTASFDYAAEYQRAAAWVAQPDGTQKIKFCLPKDKLKCFTFVFCLLADFDAGKRNFNRFLSEYFAAGDINESYARFCEEVMKPFKRAGESILRNIDPESLDVQPQKEGEKYFAAERVYIPTDVFETLCTTLSRLRETIVNEVLGSQRESAEAEEMTLALWNAVLLKNPKLIKITWIGFKNTLPKLRYTENTIRRVEGMLLQANLI